MESRLSVVALAVIVLCGLTVLGVVTLVVVLATRGQGETRRAGPPRRTVRADGGGAGLGAGCAVAFLVVLAIGAGLIFAYLSQMPWLIVIPFFVLGLGGGIAAVVTAVLRGSRVGAGRTPASRPALADAEDAVAVRTGGAESGPLPLAKPAIPLAARGRSGIDDPPPRRGRGGPPATPGRAHWWVATVGLVLLAAFVSPLVVYRLLDGAGLVGGEFAILGLLGMLYLMVVLVAIRAAVRSGRGRRAASPPQPPPAFKWPDDEQSLLRQRILAVILSVLIAGGLLVMFGSVVPKAGFGVSALMLYLVAFVTITSTIVGLLRWAFRRPSSKPAESPRPAEVPTAPPAAPEPQLPRACPKCGAAIAPGSPEGLCPRCLLGDLLPSEPRLSPTTAYGPFVPPTVEEVADFFPQLEILRLVGQGGMGAVYLARQKALDRLVALKLIRVREDDPTFTERFVREAKAMARLSHPNVVTVYESGEAGGLPYLVMEYVDGVTLRDAMREKKLSPAEALAVVPQICDALEYAHRQGVVHRDVKPENILLDKSGRVKIADFGLAKVADPDAVSLTRTHQAMGTPHYMAPEQWERPGAVDHRADIYALGVVLYELLTGELPLGRFDPPSVKARVDARIDELVLRALAKEPDRRFQHASDVKLALERFAAGGGGCGWVRTPTSREYKSKATFWGWPLVHVVKGWDPATGKQKVAKGWIAVGDGKAVGGVAIAGGSAVGVVAVSGGTSFGVLALSGGIAGGVFALAGGMAFAAVAAAAGGMALAGGLAVAGGFAGGTFAVGGSARGHHVLSGERQDADFAQRLSEWVQMVWTDYLWPF